MQWDSRTMRWEPSRRVRTDLQRFQSAARVINKLREELALARGVTDKMQEDLVLGRRAMLDARDDAARHMAATLRADQVAQRYEARYNSLWWSTLVFAGLCAVVLLQWALLCLNAA